MSDDLDAARHEHWRRSEAGLRALRNWLVAAVFAWATAAVGVVYAAGQITRQVEMNAVALSETRRELAEVEARVAALRETLAGERAALAALAREVGRLAVVLDRIGPRP